jgi:hypothetical protein
VLASRARRSVRVSAKQRMSLACLVGSCLSATRGFTLSLEHNGNTFNTARHEKSVSPFFAPAEDEPAAGGAEGVVAISFPYDGKADVLAGTGSLGLSGAPKLFLTSAASVADIEMLNTAVHEAKAALAAFRSRHRLARMHLFIKAPSMFAMALGHRLNALGPVQLYDWVDGGYRATALLL